MKIQRAVALMSTGYEILRPTRQDTILGEDSMMGRPVENGKMFPPFRLRREVFDRYLSAGWIKRAGGAGWQLWRITPAGRAEAKRRPEPSREELRAARRANAVERAKVAS